MKNLKLHSDGKENYLKELEIEYAQKINEIESDKKRSQKDKEKAIAKLNNDLEKLKRQSRFNLF